MTELEDGGSEVTSEFFYDAAGNLVLDDEHYYSYDAWNRLHRVHGRANLTPVEGGPWTGNPTNPLVKYGYDALGRRVMANWDSLIVTDRDRDYFYYDGHRVVEYHKWQEVVVDCPPDPPPACYAMPGPLPTGRPCLQCRSAMARWSTR